MLTTEVWAAACISPGCSAVTVWYPDMNSSASGAAAAEVEWSFKRQCSRWQHSNSILQRGQCSAFSGMAEDGDNVDQFPPFTLEQLQWIDRLIAARTDPPPGHDNTGGGNSGEDTSTSVPSSVPSSIPVPVPLVTLSAGSLVSTLTPTNTLVTPASQGGE